MNDFLAKILVWLAFIGAVVGWLTDCITSFPEIPGKKKSSDANESGVDAVGLSENDSAVPSSSVQSRNK